MAAPLCSNQPTMLLVDDEPLVRQVLARMLEESGFTGWIEKPILVDSFPEQVRGYCARRNG